MTDDWIKCPITNDKRLGGATVSPLHGHCSIRNRWQPDWPKTRGHEIHFSSTRTQRRKVEWFHHTILSVSFMPAVSSQVTAYLFTCHQLSQLMPPLSSCSSSLFRAGDASCVLKSIHTHSLMNQVGRRENAHLYPIFVCSNFLCNENQLFSASCSCFYFYCDETCCSSWLVACFQWSILTETCALFLLPSLSHHHHLNTFQWALHTSFIIEERRFTSITVTLLCTRVVS